MSIYQIFGLKNINKTLKDIGFHEKQHWETTLASKSLTVLAAAT